MNLFHLQAFEVLGKRPDRTEGGRLRQQLSASTRITCQYSTVRLPCHSTAPAFHQNVSATVRAAVTTVCHCCPRRARRTRSLSAWSRSRGRSETRRQHGKLTLEHVLGSNNASCVHPIASRSVAASSSERRSTVELRRRPYVRTRQRKNRKHSRCARGGSARRLDPRKLGTAGARTWRVRGGRKRAVSGSSFTSSPSLSSWDRSVASVLRRPSWLMGGDSAQDARGDRSHELVGITQVGNLQIHCSCLGLTYRP
jgi:hypothetical protein